MTPTATIPEARPWALSTLPPFPAVALKVLEELSRDEFELKQVVRWIESDPAFTAELLGRGVVPPNRGDGARGDGQPRLPGRSAHGPGQHRHWRRAAMARPTVRPHGDVLRVIGTVSA